MFLEDVYIGGMEFGYSSLSAKEATMRGYTFTVTVSDSIFGEATKVITVDAENIPQAKAKALSLPTVVSVGTLHGTIDRNPQVCLAW